MGRDISIAISARDNFTQAITTMRNANQAFNKDLTGLTTKLDTLNKTKITLKVDADKARTALKAAEKQFAATGDAADKLKLEMANQNYENVRRNLALVSDGAKQAEKDIKSLTGIARKSGNRAGTAKSSIINTLAATGATSLAGNIASNMVNTYISSAFGSEVSTLVNNALSTAAQGAAIGTAFAPGIGTAIGALAGGAAGVVQGALQNYGNKDEAFKQYYQDQYNTALETQKTSLTGGSGIASAREQNRISFSTLLGGEGNADKYLGEMTAFAAKTPFSYETLAAISKTLLAYGYKQDELLPLLEKVGDAGSALGMGTEDMTYVATALGRMQTSGKTTLEYLNPLLERGIPVWDYLSKASGKTKQEVQEMVHKGLVPGAEAAKAIADYMGASFSDNMEKQAQTFEGLTSTLEDARNELDNAMGAAYNEERKKGLKEEIDYLSGESGLKMQEAYEQIGQWKASLDNLAEQYKREALNAVMTGSTSSLFSEDIQGRLSEMYDEYEKYAADGSQEAGAKMGALLAEAQVIAQNEYNASEGAQLALESNKTLASNIKNDTGLQSNYWDAGYEMGIQFSKGLSSALQANASKVKDSAAISPEEQSGYDYMRRNNIGFGGGRGYASQSAAEKRLQDMGRAYSGSSHAYGLSYVPYNNYPAMLHEGERVLTAGENRVYKKDASAVITGNNFYIREEADIKKVASEIVEQMARAYNLAN